MRAIDTNVLVRLVARDDAQQTKQAEEFVRRGAWVSHVVLAEAVWVLTSVYGLKRRELTATVRAVLASDVLAVQDAEVIAAALDRYANADRAGFTDCLIVEIAARAGHGPLGSFDKAMAALKGVEPI